MRHHLLLLVDFLRRIDIAHQSSTLNECKRSWTGRYTSSRISMFEAIGIIAGVPTLGTSAEAALQTAL